MSGSSVLGRYGVCMHVLLFCDSCITVSSRAHQLPVCIYNGVVV